MNLPQKVEGELRKRLARRTGESLNRHERRQVAGECPGEQGEQDIRVLWTQPGRRMLEGRQFQSGEAGVVTIALQIKPTSYIRKTPKWARF